ncbi:MAG: MBL fold metallo-hydrolase [Candidatus Lambdaproteobacteria bacterium]|nr:MBL fold metallo-hydrolase [Candidatus Lambdaproteobacteria bacterium]
MNAQETQRRNSRYFSMINIRNRPAADEFELSLFGPGVGECVVVHLGQGEWLVVDSCIDRETRKPVALDYFDKLGLNPAEAVRLVIVTHWHDDHIGGASAVAKAATRADIVCSAALNCKEFQTVLGVTAVPYMRGAGVDEMTQIFELLLDRRSSNRLDITPVWAKAHTRLYQTVAGSVEALSPSDATFSRFLQEIASLLPGVGATARRAVKNTPNETAIAIWIEAGEIRALLGSDLEKGDTGVTGWQAVVNSTRRPQGRARLLKVAHHGSDGADEPRVWSDMLEPQPLAVLTPFRRSWLPRETDLERIASQAGQAFCTALPRPTRPARRAPTVEKLVRRVAPDLREVVGPMGHVRIRIKRGASTPSIERRGPAFQLRHP